MERRLAAVLTADVVGYSRLMGRDDTGTLSALRSHLHEFVSPRIQAHGGRIVKLMGDGLLAEFPSVVEAVQCAIEIQNGMADRNSEVPEETCLAFRIGVNIGDVITDGDDIYGNGVNVAARLQALADPGGICISGKVFEEVASKPGLRVEDMGERRLKNIDKPVRTYRIVLKRSVVSDAPPRLPDRPSIAVLPFTNMSGDPEQEYFADGMAEDIITGLSKFHWLFVIARNSTFVYKNQAIDVRAVARELGVRYVLVKQPH